MSVYYYKSLEKKMAIRATLQTKLACGALMVIITNVCILIAIIAYKSHQEMCKLQNRTLTENKSFQSINLAELKFRTAINDYPWMIAFMILPHEIFSGTAVIITKKWAITTAQCIEKVAKYPISMKGFRGGSTYWNRHGFYHYASNIITHEKFDLATLDYNVAMVKVLRPFMYTNEVPVLLPRFHIKTVNITKVIGWATVKDNPKHIMMSLLRIDVDLATEKLCKETLRRIKNDTSVDRSLCAYKKAEKYRIDCDFSSGSALIVDWYLIGVTSSGVMCGESHLPGIYVNITTVIEWIEDIIK